MSDMVKQFVQGRRPFLRLQILLNHIKLAVSKDITSQKQKHPLEIPTVGIFGVVFFHATLKPLKFLMGLQQVQADLSQQHDFFLVRSFAEKTLDFGQ